MSILRRLVKEQCVIPAPPPYVYDCLQYETIMGSEAYGVADTAQKSDRDIYGFCVPPKDMVFPHLAGEIEGFGRQKKRFNNWQQHHIKDSHQRSYDFDVYGIVRYFQLCMECNPNMVDSLFTPERCVVWKTPVGQLMRENRKLFLSSKAWHTFKGYAFSQAHKMKIKNPEPGSKRAESVAQFGFDVKFGYHVVRLMEECRQILTEGDIDLERNSEQLKAIRRGEWTEEAVYAHFDEQQRAMETLYATSVVPHSPDEEAIRKLLVSCLEAHFGNLGAAVTIPGKADHVLAEIERLIVNHRA